MKIKQAARTAAAILAFSCWSTVVHADIQPYMAETVKPYTAESVAPRNADSVAPRNADSVKVETITYSDGSKYTGETLNGKMHGKGILYYADGTVYDGMFRAGVPEGNGVTVWKDGTKYTGSFKQGLPEGEGVQTWPDGSKYSGQIKGGKFEGNGTLVTKDVSYTGPFKAGAMHGKGIATVNGKRYEVTYDNGKPVSAVPLDASPSPSQPSQPNAVQPYKAEEVKPYKAEEVKPFKAEEVKPFKAEEVKPFKAEEVKPFKAEEVKPFKAEDVKPFKAEDVKPFKAEEVKPYTAEEVKPHPYRLDVVLQLDSVKAYYRHNQIDLPAPPMLIGDAVMIPLDLVVDQLNATVQWKDTWDEVTITFYNKQSAVLTIGDSSAVVNGNRTAMAAAPAIIDNNTYIPLHLLSDIADQEIYYVWETGQISLNIPPGDIPDFIGNSTPEKYDNTEGDGTSANKPLFDLRDGLQWQEGFWNYSNMFPNWGALLNP
ncbi:stalk domain-containing protein [Paenibacillus mesophilus]|uniref:stalk domain-containing protein n=1 Tax=Paenibacillus mesophilus TaxID=2582849 RepID=UPI0013051447|nr:stalk domain-containing protein [Paenibacillus mesophilus]